MADNFRFYETPAKEGKPDYKLDTSLPMDKKKKKKKKSAPSVRKREPVKETPATIKTFGRQEEEASVPGNVDLMGEEGKVVQQVPEAIPAYAPLSIDDTERKGAFTDSSVFGEILMGATPLLVGLLTGNDEAGMNVAGDTLISNYKRQQALYDKSLLQKRKPSSGNTFEDKMKLYKAKRGYDKENPADKNRRYAFKNFQRTDNGEFITLKTDSVIGELTDPMTGEIVDYEVRPAYAPTSYKDATTGDRKVLDRLSLQSQGVKGGDKISQFIDPDTKQTYQPHPEGRKIVNALQTQFQKDTNVLEQGEDRLNVVLNQIKTNPKSLLANKAGVMTVIRMFEKGSLSDKDRPFYRDQNSIGGQLKTKIANLKDNEEYPKLMEEVVSLLNDFQKISRKRRQNEAYERAASAAGGGLNKNWALSVISPEHYEGKYSEKATPAKSNIPQAGEVTKERLEYLMKKYEK